MKGRERERETEREDNCSSGNGYKAYEEPPLFGRSLSVVFISFIFSSLVFSLFFWLFFWLCHCLYFATTGR